MEITLVLAKTAACGRVNVNVTLLRMFGPSLSWKVAVTTPPLVPAAVKEKG
jgi:hypothetical protein